MGDGSAVGRVGVWRQKQVATPELAKELEELGYARIWLGASPDASLGDAERLLDATSRIGVATGIVNIWEADAAEVAASYRRLEERHPGRFLLGVGAGHREATAEYVKPFEALERYLDVLDEGGVPRERRVLAALGPRVLGLARDRAAGAHPYLVTPRHTADARDILGQERLLLPEQKAVVDADPERARAVGRERVRNPYLGLSNYLASLRRQGFTDADLADGGSDALVDALAVHGDAAQVATALRAHLEAGADEVVVQLLTADDATQLVPNFRALASALWG